MRLPTLFGRGKRETIHLIFTYLINVFLYSNYGTVRKKLLVVLCLEMLPYIFAPALLSKLILGSFPENPGPREEMPQAQVFFQYQWDLLTNVK